MDQHETDWRTILLLVGAAGGAVIAYALAGLTILYAGFGAIRPSTASTSGRTPFDFFVLAAAPLMIGTIFLPAVYYSIRRLMGRRVPGERVPLGISGRLHPIRVGGAVSLNTAIARSLLVGLVVALAWIGISFLAGRLVNDAVLKWFTPLLYVLAILIPAAFFVWIAIRGLNPGSLQRRWGVLAAGIGLGIPPAMLGELLLFILVVLGLAVYLVFNPSQLATFRDLLHQLQNTEDINRVLSSAGPLLTSPIVLILALVFFSGFSPFIEEITKSLATWAVFDRLSSPAQGFAVGAISGAAFGLVESLLVSAQSDSSWTATLMVRGASTMMHIMSAALTGWGIGRFRFTRRIGPLIGMYLLAMALHGLWNGSVVLAALGSVRTTMASGARDLPGMLLIYVGTAVLILLCLAIPVAIWVINWRLRAAEAADSSPVVQPAGNPVPVTSGPGPASPPSGPLP
jgi:ABC-type maltose transport system permease subunit